MTCPEEMCVYERMGKACEPSHHKTKATDFHQSSTSRVRFVCCSVVTEKKWGGWMGVCVWVPHRQRERTSVCGDVTEWESGVVRHLWLRGRNVASHFGAGRCFCPFFDTHATLGGGGISYRWLWHSARSPPIKTKHTHTLLQWLTAWCQIVFGKSNRSNQPHRHRGPKKQSPNCSTFKEINRV